MTEKRPLQTSVILSEAEWSEAERNSVEESQTISAPSRAMREIVRDPLTPLRSAQDDSWVSNASSSSCPNLILGSRLHRLFVFGISLVITQSSFVIAASHPELGKEYSAPAEIGRELIGTRAPEWTVSEWLDGKPRTLASLRGRVVLVRWWTAPDCPYCAASADGLNELARKYADRGLDVIGMYHHKAHTPLTRSHVEAQAKRLGFTFPVAIDTDWKTLRRWWLDRADRGWTSVTFLIDREGIIRHIHPGGAYFPDEPGYAALEEAVQAALGAPH